MPPPMMILSALPASASMTPRVRRTSVLRFPDFAVDEASLRAAFSSRTRLVLLNTPHNQTGKVFTRAELDLVCELAREHDVLPVAIVLDLAVLVPFVALKAWSDPLTIALTAGVALAIFAAQWVTVRRRGDDDRDGDEHEHAGA